jgi:hypothetical protein
MAPRRASFFALSPTAPSTSPFPTWTAQSSDRDAIRRFRPNVFWGSWQGQSVPTDGGLVLVLLPARLGTFATAYRTRCRGRSVPKATATVIEGGQRYIPVRNTTRPDARTVVKGERSACVGDTCTVPDDARRIDASGLTLLPGLIDLHVHFDALGGERPSAWLSPSVAPPPAPPRTSFSSTATRNSPSRRSATSGSS